MEKMQAFLPEGSYQALPSVQKALQGIEGLLQAQRCEMILEAVCTRCTPERDLIFELGGVQGIMPRECCALGISEGETREIAILTRVGKPTCFAVTDIDTAQSPPVAYLSRTAVQRRAQAHFLHTLQVGEVIRAVVTHLEPFGAFVDIGCGLISLIGLQSLSVSRISHPADRVSVGQPLLAAVQSIDRESGRITLTHRELLGTWAQNAALFTAGETVRGLVRSPLSYGVFIELAPNLSGLAEPAPSLYAGDAVSVYIKSICPERMKIKLGIIDRLPPMDKPAPLRYFFREGERLQYWRYTPPGCARPVISTLFSE